MTTDTQQSQTFPFFGVYKWNLIATEDQSAQKNGICLQMKIETLKK